MIFGDQVRCCFEMGNKDSNALNVAGSSGIDLNNSRVRNAMAAAVYTGKVVILGAVIKTVFKFTLPLHVAQWANSYACVISSCFWDTLICGVIMEEVELTVIGVATGPEVFNEIIDHYQEEMRTNRHDESLSNMCKLQVVRSIAVANGTTHGDGWHSTTELLLRHVVECFDMVGARINPQEISSVPIFLSDLAKLDLMEQRVVMSTVLLAQLLDGEISKEEIETWQRIFMAVGMEWSEERGVALVGVAVAFRHRQHITAETLRLVIDGNKVVGEEGILDRSWHKSQKALHSLNAIA